MSNSVVAFRAALDQASDRARIVDRLRLRRIVSSESLSAVFHEMVLENMSEEQAVTYGEIGDGTILEILGKWGKYIIDNLEMIIDLAIKLMQAIKDIFL